MRQRHVIGLAAGVLCLTLLAGCGSEASKLNEQGLDAYAKGSYAEAVNYFENAIVQDNQNPDYYVNKGMAYLELQDYDSAHSCFDSALRLNGSCQGAYRGNGIAYMEAGRYEEAMSSFDTALACEAGRASESEYDILLYRGETQVRMGDYDGAVDTYDVLMKAQGASARLYYLRGVAQVKGGDIEGGIEDLNQATAGSTDYNMYLNCYYCLADAGEQEAGIQYLKNALTVGDSSTASHKARGAVHYLLGDYSAALAEFEYDKEKADTETLIYMGLCYQAQGDSTGAYEAFSRALAQGGDNAEVYYQMGMCMFSTQDYEKALEYLDKGLEMGEETHKQEMLYTKAVCYERLERFSEARSGFESYVALYGSNEELDKELAFLRTR